MSERNFSRYIVYVDESGHASPESDPNFPCFVLAFSLFEKKTYCAEVVPDLQRLKFQFFGHDMVIFHEREIRKSLGEFALLKNRKTREGFFTELNNLISRTEFAIISHTILKDGRHTPADNLYHIALQDCLEKLCDKMGELGEKGATVHVVFEMRGKNEDNLLELEFRRICAGENKHEVAYPFVPVFGSKQSNSTGLQFADLIARPIGLAALRPAQPNRAYEILKTKDLNAELSQGELDL